MARRCVTSVAIFAVLAMPAIAGADTPKLTEAHTAYDEGAAAYDARDYKTAVTALARADKLAPNETVLRLALISCARSDEAAPCMNLVERARVRDILKEQRDAVTQRFAARTTRVIVDCTGAEPCTARLDGVPLESVTWVEPGPHVLDLESPLGAEKRQLDLPAAGVVRVAPSGQRQASTPAATALTFETPQAQTTQDPHARTSGLSPTWFWIGAGVTAALGTAATLSGVDTLNRHDEFAARRDETNQERGLDAQLRTNVLIAGTAGAAAVTALLGLVFVRWSAR